MTKAEKFTRSMTKGLLEMGATEVDHHYPLRLITKAGTLRIDIPEQSKDIYTVFTKFEEPDLAIGIVSHSNPYSGKWNFNEWSRGVDPIGMANQILDTIKKTIAGQTSK